MLFLIFISLVLPYFVLIVAVRLVFMSFVICQFSVSIPLLFSTYSSASSHALSYAFVRSRYTIYRGFFFLFCGAMLSFSIVRWSFGNLPSLPPACASDIYICGRVRLSIIRSYTFPMLLDTVIPLSFAHLPFFPFPLYSRVIIPLCHSSGIFVLMCRALMCLVGLFSNCIV